MYLKFFQVNIEVILYHSRQNLQIEVESQEQ